MDMFTDGHLGGYIRGGDPGTWCPALWKWLVERYEVRSVLDVGCGEAHSTRHFVELGCDAHGVDGCRQAIADSVLPGRVRLHDYCQGPLDAAGSYDLVWSCELLEHIEERYLPNVLQTFARASKVIAVTHAFPGQEDGHHHVNCQPGRYWIRHIESLGYVCAVDASRLARKVTLHDHMWVNHFARSGLVFLHRSIVPQWPRDHAAANRSPRLKSLAITAGLKLSVDYWAHRRRRHAWKRQQRRDASRRLAS